MSDKLVPYELPIDPDALNRALMAGDLSKLSPADRTQYYLALCQSIGLNWLSRPFIVLKTQDGSMQWYATVGCAEQLRKRDRVSMRVLGRELTADGMYIVTVEASTPDGRVEQAQGIVTVAEPRMAWKKNPQGDSIKVEEKTSSGEPIMIPLIGKARENAYLRAECVPIDSEILTKRGWQTHDAVQIGEEVLAYDCDTDRCLWAPLEHITRYEEAVTMRFGTTHHAFRCTPDHAWVVQHSAPYRPRGVKPTGPYRNRKPDRMLVEAYAITTGQRVILAAPAEGGTSPLTPAEAAVLGWVMTDGTIQHRKAIARMAICQSKEEHFEAIETALTGTGYRVYKHVGKPSTRQFGEYLSECKPQHWWYISEHDSGRLLAKAGIAGPADLPALIPQLSTEARHAMFAAMMAADGDARRNFGKKRKPGVMDAWQILATLEGYALGKLSEGRIVNTQRARLQRTMMGHSITWSDPMVEDVWCPTTRYGTWVMRQNGNVTITGNSKAKRRATLAICGLGLHVAEADAGQEVRFDPQTGALEEPEAALTQEGAGEPAPVGREQAARNVALLFDRSEGKPEEVEHA